MIVDGAGDQFLAGAGLAGDDHGHVALCQHLDGRKELQHCRIPADHVGKGVPVRQLFAQVLDLVEQPPPFEDLLRRQQDIVWLERFGDVIAGTVTHRLDSAFDAAVTSDHDDIHNRPAFPDLADQSHAVAARHFQIHERQGELRPAHVLQRLLCVGCRLDGIAVIHV